jgi:hypothetical protein
MAENDGSQPRPEELRRQMDEALKSGAGPKVARFALACLGAVPLLGGAIGGIGSAWSEADQDRMNKIFASWLKLHEQELKEIGVTLFEVMQRVDTKNAEVQKRLESKEYLAIVNKAFRDWSAAESEDKRILIRNLLANAGAAVKICSDDVVRLFIEWVGRYSELHFKVIRAIYREPDMTRQEIWERIHGEQVREDSAEADMFKLLIHDLSTGRIIRQHRDTDGDGNFLKRRPRRPAYRSSTMKSAFDDEHTYELTELGKQFVQYTMEDVLHRIAGPTAEGVQASPTPTNEVNDGPAPERS